MLRYTKFFEHVRVTANTCNAIAMAGEVLASFYVLSESGGVNGQPIHKEKFNVPVDKEVHNELHKFKIHFAKFTSIN